jgi:hypothetical protein
VSSCFDGPSKYESPALDFSFFSRETWGGKSEWVRIVFLQAHRETDSFFAAAGVQVAPPTIGLIHFRRSVFSSSQNQTGQHPW